MTEDEIAAVLADHIWIPKQVGPSDCWSADDNPCGLVFHTGGEHRAHVAAVLRARLDQEARDSGR